MQANDFDDFDAMMQAISAMYGKELSPGVLSLYWQGLQGYDLVAVRQALNRHVQNPDTGQFMPKIADVRRMLGGTTQDSALVAWSKVDQALRQLGTYCDVVFDDAIIHRTIHDMGGWVALGTKTEDEWPFVAKEFENRYRGYKMRNETPEYQAVLIGIAGGHNRKGGFRVDPPRLIGDQEAARRVMERGSDKPLLQIGTATPAHSSLPVLVSNKAA